MASKPNPSWTQAQKDKFKDIMEATEQVIPYFGQEIPRLDNHTREQVVDIVGVVKSASGAFDKVEKILVERFKSMLGEEKEVIGSKYRADLSSEPRYALNQGVVKEMLEEFDTLGIDLVKFLESIKAGHIEIPEDCKSVVTEKSTSEQFFGSTSVKTLRVKVI